MIKNESIFHILEQAKNNNGRVYIYNYNEDELIKNATDAKELIEGFFQYDLSLSWMIFDIYISRSDDITPKQRRELKRLKVEYKDHGISFDAYELFRIPEDKRTVDAFDFYIDFFSLCKEHILEHQIDQRIQFVNEQSPLRLEVNVKENKELENKIQKIINSDEAKDWFYSLAKGLRSMGVWSWFFVTEKGLLDFDEDYDFNNLKFKKLKERKKLKEM